MKMVSLLALLALAGCAAPPPQGQVKADDNTSYTVTEQPGGFAIALAYAKYQFVPESAAVQASCKQALTATAYEVAEKRGRKIEPVNEQRIKLEMGRNGFTGITSCVATAPVAWAK